MNGVPLPVVSRLLGHSTVRMTLRYAHLADRDIEAEPVLPLSWQVSMDRRKPPGDNSPGVTVHIMSDRPFTPADPSMASPGNRGRTDRGTASRHPCLPGLPLFGGRDRVPVVSILGVRGDHNRHW